MHSFDNGNAHKSKTDNWYQLIKIFKKVGLVDVLSETEARWIASLEDGAAVNFLSRSYEVLTSRRLSLTVKQPTIGKEPGFMRDTSLGKVRNTIKLNDIKEGYDVQKNSTIVANVIDSHHKELMEQRFQDPERFSVSSTNSQSIERSNRCTMPLLSLIILPSQIPYQYTLYFMLQPQGECQISNNHYHKCVLKRSK